MTKDKETFKKMLSLAATDSFAKKLVNHCLAVTHELYSGKLDKRQEMKDLMLKVNDVTNFLGQPKPKVRMKYWERKGYVMIFTSFLWKQHLLANPLTPEEEKILEECKKALDEMAASSVA